MSPRIQAGPVPGLENQKVEFFKESDLDLHHKILFFTWSDNEADLSTDVTPRESTHSLRFLAVISYSAGIQTHSTPTLLPPTGDGRLETWFHFCMTSVEKICESQKNISKLENFSCIKKFKHKLKKLIRCIGERMEIKIDLLKIPLKY